MHHRAFSKTISQTERGCWSAEPRLPHEGLEVGLAVGEVVGEAVGEIDGEAVGSEVVGEAVGSEVVGEVVGEGVGQLSNEAPASYADMTQAQP